MSYGLMLCFLPVQLALGSSCDVLLGNVETTPLPLVESARQSLALLADWITTSQPHFVLRVAPNNKQVQTQALLVKYNTGRRFDQILFYS